MTPEPTDWAGWREWMHGDKMTPLWYHCRFNVKKKAHHAGPPRRLTTRITEHVQDTLQAAADLVGATLNQFVVQAALEKAERVIESETTLLLTRREALRVFELTQAPPVRNEQFLRAQARHRTVIENAVFSTQ